MRFLIASWWFGLSAAHAAGDCLPVTRVGLSDLGYTSYREKGRIAGIAVDVINELSRRSGCKFKFYWYPRQRLFVELQAGHVDMAMGASRTPERDAYASHLPYAYLQYDLILREPQEHKYASLSDFVERGTGRLNVTRGLAYDTPVAAQLARLESAGRLEFVNDFETVFGKLDIGRIDGTVATASIYRRYLPYSRFKAGLLVIPIAEASPQLTGMYVSRTTVPVGMRWYLAAVLKEMVAKKVVLGYYARYIDDATIKRTFRLGMVPVLDGLSAPD